MNRQTNTFRFHSQYPCSAQYLYDYHSRPYALARLLPPWENTTIISSDDSLVPGSVVDLRMHAGPFPFSFQARHIENIPGRMFRDIQERGPFSAWSHSHFFEDTDNGSKLTDEIEYRLPVHQLLPQCIKSQVEKKLQRIFRYRSLTLAEDIALHKRCSHTPLRILISGASGVLGKSLQSLLSTGGHTIWTLVRRQPDRSKNEIFWDPARGFLSSAELPEIDAVIHLAGEYIGLKRWDEQKKKQVIDSRIKGTDLLSRTLATMKKPPKVLLSASAVGYYGDCHDKIIDESESPGKGFISKVCKHWEQAVQPARDAGIRTVLMRMGVSMTPRNGALKRILSTAPLGFMRRFGSGNQYISWISEDDLISAMLHMLVTPTLEGPVNIAAPEPVKNSELMQVLAKTTGRPLLLPMPARLFMFMYGQMGQEIILSGSRVSSKKLIDSGFTFRHPELETTLQNILGLNGN